MRKHQTLFSTLLVLAFSGCRSAADGAAVTTPAAEPLPAVASTLPPSLAADGADLAYDHRGGFGPVRMEHVDVFFSEARARCRRISAGGSQVSETLDIGRAAIESLREARAALVQQPPRTVRRQARVHDLGVMTLSVGLDAPLIVDGAVTLEPYPEALVQALLRLKDRCLQQPAVPSDEAPETTSEAASKTTGEVAP